MPMQLSECAFEELGHTAEIGLAVQAPTPQQLFACAGRGMFALLRVEPDTVQPIDTRRITVTAFDPESLLVDWLSELVYLYETTGALYTDCTVESWSPTALTAAITGYRPAAAPSVHIKAVTYHQLILRNEGEHWTAQVFFDI